jgi:uncharacterized membrane protein YgdD (TMEM256/DUF423 family)
MAGAADRVIGVAAGLLGASGVAASAAGAHATASENLSVAGLVLMSHAAALLALAVPRAGSDPVRRIAAFAMIIGVSLFAGDLVLAALRGRHLFPMAAPTGGLLIIASWVVAALAHIGGRRT